MRRTPGAISSTTPGASSKFWSKLMSSAIPQLFLATDAQKISFRIAIAVGLRGRNCAAGKGLNVAPHLVNVEKCSNLRHLLADFQQHALIDDVAAMQAIGEFAIRGTDAARINEIE